MAGAELGLRTVLLTLSGLLAGCSLLGKGNDPYNIELRYVDWAPTAAEEADFQAAADLWASVILEGFRDHVVTVTQADIDAFPEAAGCAPIDEEIDDLVLFVRRQEIIGPLAMGAVCVLDSDGHGLPMVSRLIVGEEILDGGDFEELRLGSLQHELGHALGLTPAAWNADFGGFSTP